MAQAISLLADVERLRPQLVKKRRRVACYNLLILHSATFKRPEARE